MVVSWNRVVSVQRTLRAVITEEDSKYCTRCINNEWNGIFIDHLYAPERRNAGKAGGDCIGILVARRVYIVYSCIRRTDP